MKQPSKAADPISMLPHLPKMNIVKLQGHIQDVVGRDWFTPTDSAPTHMHACMYIAHNGLYLLQPPALVIKLSQKWLLDFYKDFRMWTIKIPSLAISKLNSQNCSNCFTAQGLLHVRSKAIGAIQYRNSYCQSNQGIWEKAPTNTSKRSWDYTCTVCNHA